MEQKDFDIDKHQEFYRKLNTFCIQAVSSPYCTLFIITEDDETCGHKTKAILNNNAIAKNLLSVYLNQCWQSYHDKNDDFVVKAIDDLLKIGLMKHASCIFSWIFDHCSQMILSIKELSEEIDEEISDVDTFRECLNNYMNFLTAIVAKENCKIKKDISCDNKCKIYNFKKDEDFIIIQKTDKN